jgi:hypothetical protein
VFKACKTPYISSNGFTFHLNEEADPILNFGYIVPYWDDQDLAGEMRPHGYTTSLLLPLKEGQRQEVLTALQQLAPETILFLSKIKSIEIEVEGATRGFKVSENPTQPEIVTLSQCEGAQIVKQNSFWLCTVICPTSYLKKPEEKRRGVATREASVALPLDDYQVQSTKSVFSYLPTETPGGLPFISNGDFILTASRESIDQSREWNDWVKLCIAHAFINGLSALAGAIQQGAVQLGDSGEPSEVYRFIPDRNRSMYGQYFDSVHRYILTELRKEKIVWSCQGKFETADTVRCCPKEWHDILSHAPDGDEIESASAKPLVHPAALKVFRIYV